MVEEWVMERAKGWVVWVQERANEGARETDKGEREAWRGRETNGRENEFSLAVR